MRNWKVVTLPILFTTVVVMLIGCAEDNSITQTEEQNKALVRRLHAEVSQGNKEIFDGWPGL